MKSMNPSFIHSFHVLAIVYEQENQRMICNTSDKNNEHFLFTSIWVNSFIYGETTLKTYVKLKIC